MGLPTPAKLPLPRQSTDLQSSSNNIRMWLAGFAIIGFFGFIDTSYVDIKCPRNGHYVHVRPLTGCSEYYTCNNGTKEFSSCPYGTIYSSSQKKCKESGYCHELVCTGRIDGRYPDPIENCTRIYKCSAGRISYVHTCAKDGARCSGIHKEIKCPKVDYSTALVIKKHDICETRKNGFYSLKDCSRYVKCVDGVEDSFYICPENKYFNGSSCILNYTCENTCTSKTNGYHPDESTDCQEYVHCKAENVVTRCKCPSGTIFNGSSCVVSSTYECPFIKKCADKLNGIYPDYSKSCSTYYECLNGIVIYERTCPDGKVFNGTTCVFKTSFYCQGPDINFECFGKKGYFYDIESKCNEYHYCDSGKKTVFKCPIEQVFDGKSCVSQNQFQCPEDKFDSCKNKTPGYYQNIESNCQSYHFCFEGNKITYVCPQGKIFNGNACVSSSIYICPYKDDDCEDKSDGYHVKELNKKEYFFCKNNSKLITLKCGLNEDSICNFASNSENICSKVKKGYVTDSSCRIYHTCSNFALIESGVCKETHVFNGKLCVPQHYHQCIAQRDSCRDLSNGFYQNFESGCQKYFFCINGDKTELECPEGMIHNGSICVNKSSYKCPIAFYSNKNMIHFN